MLVADFSGIKVCALVLLIGLAGCGDAPERSTGQFCRELQANAAQIQASPTGGSDNRALVALFSKMAEVAPLEIEGDWEAFYGSFKTAIPAIDDGDVRPAITADALSALRQSAASVAAWARINCGIALSVGTMEPGVGELVIGTPATETSVGE